MNRLKSTATGPRAASTRRPLRAFPLAHLSLVALCLSALALAGCGVGERRSGLPAGAQEAIDRLTEHFAERRYAEIYAEAADEWRASVSADDNRATLERAREQLGRVVSRATVRASEQQQEGAAGSSPSSSSSSSPGGHTVSVNYNTRFERADAHESVTLVERAGRWQLARYTVNSDALK